MDWPFYYNYQIKILQFVNIMENGEAQPQQVWRLGRDTYRASPWN